MRAWGPRCVRAAGIAALLSLASGCGSDHATVLTGPPLPPLVTEVHPAPRSFGVAYDSVAIYADFAEPLDSTTVTARNVFLKINTRRLPITVSRAGDGRRVRIVSAQAFQLGETYTVELKPDLVTEGGRSLAETYWWQFTITGIRRLEHPVPSARLEDETRFAPLRWDATEASAGAVTYQVFAGDDSAAVAQSTTPLAQTSSAYYVPFSHPWGLDATIYWRVVAINANSEERVSGPVWSFRTAAPGAVLDSLTLPANRWGYRNRTATSAVCLDARMISSTNSRCLVGWDWSSIAGRRVVRARLDVSNSTLTNPAQAQLFTTSSPVTLSPCDITWSGPPFPDRLMAERLVPAPFQFRFQGDTLSTCIAALARGVPISGFMLRSDATVTYATPATITLHYYR